MKKMVFVLMTQLMMLIPAFSALILNLYLFKRGNLIPKKAKIFFYYFIPISSIPKFIDFIFSKHIHSKLRKGFHHDFVFKRRQSVN